MTDEAGYYAGTHRTQLDGSTYARENCAPTTCANGARASTGGVINASGAYVRSLVDRDEETSPATAGWSLDDQELAMSRLGVPFEIRHRQGWAGVVAAHEAGLAVSLPGDSEEFGNATCSGDFDGDHSILIHPGVEGGLWPIADPICKARRYERPVVLRFYAENFGGANFSFGVFTNPVPKEDDVEIRTVKAEDWQPTKNEITNASNGVLRRTPDRAAPIFERINLGGIIRTIAEVAAGGQNWRLTERGGQPAYLLRSDWDPTFQGGDPATDQQLTDLIARKLPGADAARIAGMKSKVAALNADIAND